LDKEVVMERRNCGEGRKSRKSHKESRNLQLMREVIRKIIINA
jgi:hypothetical protein